LPDGVLVNGFWGAHDVLENEWGVDFFVANFPYQFAEGETIMPPNFYVAKPAGMYSYATVLVASRTIHKLDHGIIWTPPPPIPLTPEQIAAAKAIAEQKKKAGEAAALKYNQDPAAKGDAYGLFRMGERYRDGDGVNKDPSKAKEYFEKAAAAGNPEAATALKKLLPSNP
jgi:TPR repeat protein